MFSMLLQDPQHSNCHLRLPQSVSRCSFEGANFDFLPGRSVTSILLLGVRSSSKLMNVQRARCHCC